GRELQAVWRRWAVLGSKAGQFTDPGITANVRWELKGTSLVRTETLSTAKPLEVRRMWMVLPSTANEVSTTFIDGRKKYAFQSADGTLNVEFHSSTGSPTTSIRASGNSPLGRGSRGAIPLLLEFSQDHFTLSPHSSITWTLTMSAAQLEATSQAIK